MDTKRRRRWRSGLDVGFIQANGGPASFGPFLFFFFFFNNRTNPVRAGIYISAEIVRNGLKRPEIWPEGKRLRETKQHYIPNPSAILLPKNPYQTKKQLKPIIGITHLRPKDKNTSDRRLGIEHLNNYSQNRSNIPNK